MSALASSIDTTAYSTDAGPGPASAAGPIPGLPPAATTRVSDVDRLSLTIFFAVVLHAIVILGVSFGLEDHFQPAMDAMEIILVQKHSTDTPDDARYLAQANLQGGGNSDSTERPTAPLSSPQPDPVATIAGNPASGARTPSRQTTPAVLTSEFDATYRTPASPASRQPSDATDTQNRPGNPGRRPLDTQALLEQSIEIASLDVEIKQALRTFSERPRKKFISASTREFKYASYMEAWRAKVERIGNLNYPDEARRKKLHGGLVLDVALNADGSINDIVLRRSSGHRVLDDAAMRIVRLAAPFAPFPAAIRNETDILNITRTWQFLSSGSLRSR